MKVQTYIKMTFLAPKFS